MPKLRHYDHLNTARFVTFSCYHRHKLLTKPSVISAFLKTLKTICTRYTIRLIGYVVMPEHVHLIVLPPEDLRLGPVIGELKSKSASLIITEGLINLPDDCRISRDGRERQVFWQARCYDHNCRTYDTILEKINYCHNNPVKRGLVSEPGQWRWSSFSWFDGSTEVPIEMDGVT